MQSKLLVSCTHRLQKDIKHMVSKIQAVPVFKVLLTEVSSISAGASALKNLFAST